MKIAFERSIVIIIFFVYTRNFILSTDAHFISASTVRVKSLVIQSSSLFGQYFIVLFDVFSGLVASTSTYRSFCNPRRIEIGRDRRPSSTCFESRHDSSETILKRTRIPITSDTPTSQESSRITRSRQHHENDGRHRRTGTRWTERLHDHTIDQVATPTGTDWSDLSGVKRTRTRRVSSR